MNSGEPMYSLRECGIKPINGKIQQVPIHWQSDYSMDTSARRRTGEQMRTKLVSLTSRARENPRCKFISLAHLLTEDFLEGCFWELKRDKATGIDGVSVEEYEVGLEENIRNLVARLKAKRYKPQPVRRTYIPKSDGGKRGLGIPTVEDKTVQLGIKKILKDLLNSSATVMTSLSVSRAGGRQKPLGRC